MNTSQFTIGTYTCPGSSAEVCSTRSRGSRSRCTAWRAMENAPEMVACDAMTVAAVARITSHGRNTAGTR